MFSRNHTVFPEINRGGAAVLTSEAGEAVAKAPQNTGPTASGKESLGTWFVGNRTALMQCSYKGFAICIPPSWAKPEKHEQIGLSKLLKLICFLQARSRSVSSQDIVRIFKLKYDVCKQDTENQLRVLCKKELISDNDQFITMNSDAGVLTNRIL